MFLSALQPYVVFILIAAVLIQYGFAVFCLLKLAFMDITKNKYILWNLLILFAFYVGGAVFLVYYYKHPELRIKKTPEQVDGEQTEQTEQTEQAEPTKEQSAEQPNPESAESDDDNTDKSENADKE